MKIAALDIGGTHARMAIATIAPDGVIALGKTMSLRTQDHTGIESAWRAFGQIAGNSLPDDAAVAIAAPIGGETVRMTNAGWSFRAAGLAERLGLSRTVLLNDFAAVAHAVAGAPRDALVHIAGPDRELPRTGTVSVIGPGTGLGVAQIHRTRRDNHVQATEGGHIGFSPRDSLEDALFARMRARHGRVSVERLVSGPGIVEIHAALAGGDATPLGDAAIWQRGLSGEDHACAAAVERFCELLGSAAGDYALVHGAVGVVLSGSLANRMRHQLTKPGFAGGFTSKGRYERWMAGIPVKLFTSPEPGLLGAAVAFAKEYGT